MNTPSRRRYTQPLEIGDETVLPGESRTVEIEVAPTFSNDDMSLSVQVVRGVRPGPTLFVCAAIHGDEINGIEIIRRVLKTLEPRRMSGSVLAIPIVNVYGFNNHSRYLPDGRDLNRSFPGSPSGSLTGRLAHTFMQEIVAKCTHGIDLHTGGRHRSNFPQIRAELNDPVVKGMSQAFGAPIVIDSRIRDGSLREYATEIGVPVLLYESCEALRFDEVYIRAGVKGIINVMRHIGMLRRSRARAPQKPIISKTTQWVRSPGSGVHRVLIPPGARSIKAKSLGWWQIHLAQMKLRWLHPSRASSSVGRTYRRFTRATPSFILPKCQHAPSLSTKIFMRSCFRQTMCMMRITPATRR